MKDPNIKTRVVHSESKTAYNVVGTDLGEKHKIARVPYLVVNEDWVDERNKTEALEHAKFISECFNNSGVILEVLHNESQKDLLKEIVRILKTRKEKQDAKEESRN